jgi:regulator of replication initiation timing
MAARITELLRTVQQQEGKIKSLEAENSNLKIENRNLKVRGNSNVKLMSQSVGLEDTYKTYAMPKSTHKQSQRVVRNL